MIRGRFSRLINWAKLRLRLPQLFERSVPPASGTSPRLHVRTHYRYQRPDEITLDDHHLKEALVLFLRRNTRFSSWAPFGSAALMLFFSLITGTFHNALHIKAEYWQNIFLGAFWICVLLTPIFGLLRWLCRTSPEDFVRKIKGGCIVEPESESRGAETDPHEIPGATTVSGDNASAGDLMICSATYGRDDKQVDVADVLRTKIRNNTLEEVVGNHLKGDPFYGIGKILAVEYMFRGEVHRKTIPEGDVLRLP